MVQFHEDASDTERSSRAAAAIAICRSMFQFPLKNIVLGPYASKEFKMSLYSYGQVSFEQFLPSGANSAMVQLHTGAPDTERLSRAIAVVEFYRSMFRSTLQKSHVWAIGLLSTGDELLLLQGQPH
jgi:hypothetical protein